MKSGTVGPYSWPTIKISYFWKSKMAVVATLENRKITVSQQWLDLHKIWHYAVVAPVVKKCFKIQYSGRLPFWKKISKSHYLAIFWPILTKFGMMIQLPSVLWCCWLGGRKGIRPVKNWVVGCWCGCLERDADLHMAQLMPLPLTVSCFNKIQSGFTFLVPAYLGSPGKGPLNVRACVRACVCWHYDAEWEL